MVGLVLNGSSVIDFQIGIGCAGEIRIKEEEDYAAWAIEIYVKFRDTEKLQLLTGQRQSGGVCYLPF